MSADERPKPAFIAELTDRKAKEAALAASVEEALLLLPALRARIEQLLQDNFPQHELDRPQDAAEALDQAQHLVRAEKVARLDAVVTTLFCKILFAGVDDGYVMCEIICEGYPTTNIPMEKLRITIKVRGLEHMLIMSQEQTFLSSQEIRSVQAPPWPFGHSGPLRTYESAMAWARYPTADEVRQYIDFVEYMAASDDVAYAAAKKVPSRRGFQLDRPYRVS